MICPHCLSDYTHSHGKRKDKIRYKCVPCGRTFSVPVKSEISTETEKVSVLNCEFTHPIRLHCATDIHHGAIEHHHSKFDEFIEAVKEDDNARFILNGDNIECIPPNYKISQRGQAVEPDDQHLSFLERIKPIRNKCLFIRGGNHDYLRSVNLLGFDVSRVLADQLQVPYCPMPNYTIIKINGKRWKFVSGHGKGAGKNGDLELERLSSIYVEGDIFYLGHNHQLYFKVFDSLRVEDDEEKLRKRYFIRGGSFLKYPEYARYSVYPLVRTGWITLEFTEQNIRCRVN